LLEEVEQLGRSLAHVCGFLVGGYRETRMKSGEEGCWAEYHRGTLVE